MPLKIKLSQFSSISSSVLTDVDKLPILHYDESVSDFKNKTITVKTLKDELFKENGISVVGDSYITGNLFISGSLVSEVFVVNTASVIVGGNISASGNINGYVSDEFMVTVSDEASNISVGSNKLQFIFPFTITGSALTAYVYTAPVGSQITCSARIIGGSTISSSINDSNKSGSVNVTYYINKYQEVAVDINQVGSTTPGKGLKLIFEGTRRI